MQRTPRRLDAISLRVRRKTQKTQDRPFERRAQRTNRHQLEAMHIRSLWLSANPWPRIRRRQPPLRLLFLIGKLRLQASAAPSRRRPHRRPFQMETTRTLLSTHWVPRRKSCIAQTPICGILNARPARFPARMAQPRTIVATRASSRGLSRHLHVL